MLDLDSFFQHPIPSGRRSGRRLLGSRAALCGCRGPARRTHLRAAASSPCRRPQHYSRRPGSSSSSSSFSSQGSRTSTPASLHSVFMCMAGFTFIFSVQPLLVLLIHRDSMRTLGFSKLSARAFSHQSILRSTARFPSRGILHPICHMYAVGCHRPSAHRSTAYRGAV